MKPPNPQAQLKVKLSASQALELSLRLEQTGVEFYRMLADEIKEEPLRNFFLGLTGMELEHEKTVRELLAAETDRPEQKLAFDETLTDREFFVRIRDLIVSGAFPSGLDLFKKLDRFQTPTDAFPLALKMEKRSIGVYQYLLRFQLTEAARKTIERLIEDEQSHLEEVGKVHRRVKRGP